MTKYTLQIIDGKPCGKPLNPLGKKPVYTYSTFPDIDEINEEVYFEKLKEWEQIESSLKTLEIDTGYIVIGQKTVHIFEDNDELVLSVGKTFTADTNEEGKLINLKLV